MLSSGQKTAITGSNGSGKSTLIKCIAGQMPLSSGQIRYRIRGVEIPSSEIYRQLALSAPYLELPEEFTLIEFLRFHFRFKSLKNGISIEDAVQYMYLEKSTEKTIQHFSSGMKQRLKLGMCFFSACPLLLLDEPTSNLDERGVQWFQGLVADFGNDKSIIVGSNDPREYQFCTEKVAIENFK